MLPPAFLPSGQVCMASWSLCLFWSPSSFFLTGIAPSMSASLLVPTFPSVVLLLNIEYRKAWISNQWNPFMPFCVCVFVCVYSGIFHFINNRLGRAVLVHTRQYLLVAVGITFSSWFASNDSFLLLLFFTPKWERTCCHGDSSAGSGWFMLWHRATGLRATQWPNVAILVLSLVS